MKAVLSLKYGNHEALEYRDIEKPVPEKNEVLIKVYAVSLNASDKEYLTGYPAYARLFAPFKPVKPVLGSDVAGVVEAVGKNVTRFTKGDAVIADLLYEKTGGLAEYTCIPEKILNRKPESMDFATASTLLQAAEVAFQGIIDKGHVKPGQKVLINGAGGAAGSFAIQLAKHYGAEVTGVDNAGKLDFMQSLGADHVMDYAKEDCTAKKGQYDLILDLIAAHPLFHYRGALKPRGKYLMVGGPFSSILKTAIFGSLLSMLGKKKTRLLIVKPCKRQKELISLVASGHIKPVIGHQFQLKDAAEGFKLLIQGEARGKVVITVP